jgi:hypothetical protein
VAARQPPNSPCVTSVRPSTAEYRSLPPNFPISRIRAGFHDTWSLEGSHPWGLWASRWPYPVQWTCPRISTSERRQGRSPH